MARLLLEKLEENVRDELIVEDVPIEEDVPKYDTSFTPKVRKGAPLLSWKKLNR